MSSYNLRIVYGHERKEIVPRLIKKYLSVALYLKQMQILVLTMYIKEVYLSLFFPFVVIFVIALIRLYLSFFLSNNILLQVMLPISFVRITFIHRNCVSNFVRRILMYIRTILSILIYFCIIEKISSQNLVI